MNTETMSISQKQEQLSKWSPVFTCWYPHSGGRWLNRGLVGRHPSIVSSEAFSPLITASLDDLLALDTTFQVHKSRTMKNREHEFQAIKSSFEDARFYGLLSYFYSLMETQKREEKQYYAALPVGSKIVVPNLKLMFKLMPKMKLVHLVRNPIECFASSKSRAELGGDASLAAALWQRLNYELRQYSDRNNYHLIKYEDLVSDTKTTCGKLLASFDLSWDEKLEEGLNEYHGRNNGLNIIDQVTSSEKQIINDICDSEAKIYGYQL